MIYTCSCYLYLQFLSEKMFYSAFLLFCHALYKVKTWYNLKLKIENEYESTYINPQLNSRPWTSFLAVLINPHSQIVNDPIPHTLLQNVIDIIFL